MKKLVFGLIVTVLFNTLSYGRIIKNPIYHNNVELYKTNLKDYTGIIGKSPKNLDNAVWCNDFEVMIGIPFIGSVTTHINVCCTGVFTPLIHCFNPRATNPDDNYVCVGVDDLEPSIRDVIKSKKLKEITIEESNVSEIEKGFFSIRKGTYKIESGDKGQFIKFVIEEVKK